MSSRKINSFHDPGPTCSDMNSTFGKTNSMVAKIAGENEIFSTGRNEIGIGNRRKRETNMSTKRVRLSRHT